MEKSDSSISHERKQKFVSLPPHSAEASKEPLERQSERRKKVVGGTIPRDWIHLEATGDVVPGTRIICFKTPFDHIPGYPREMRNRKHIFTTKDLVKRLEDKGVRLGLIVDLTDSTRYYDPLSLQKHNVKVLKIRIPGKQVPSRDCFAHFSKEVMGFLQSTPEDLFVGIHCTHGINRTGWFVCKYLMNHHNLSARDAIKLFTDARGYPVHRDYIVHDLISSCSKSAAEDRTIDLKDGGMTSAHGAVVSKEA